MKLWRLGFALAFGIAVRCVSGCQKQEDNSCCTPVQRRLSPKFPESAIRNPQSAI